jgi:small-conductance mechanosensitive channel
MQDTTLALDSVEVPGTEAVRQIVGRVEEISFFGRPLFRLGGEVVTPASLIAFAVILLAAVLLSRVLQRALERAYTRRGLDEGVQYALNRLLNYVVLALGLLVALENLGISVTALAGIGAILAVGIGFGLQNIAQNFVSGLILLLERPVKKGDFVEVGDIKGTVREIHARATVITTVDNVDVLVPNGQFITERVVNQTFANRRVRMRVEVGVAYGSDIALVCSILERVARAHEAVLPEPAPKVWFTEFGDSSLNFTLLVWVPEPLLQWQVASDLRFGIEAAFREAGVEIPFPQRDLHLRGGWPLQTE